MLESREKKRKIISINNTHPEKMLPIYSGKTACFLQIFYYLSILLPWGGTSCPGKSLFFSQFPSCLKKGERMQYTRIGIYQVKPGSTLTADEAIRRSQAGMLLIFRN